MTFLRKHSLLRQCYDSIHSLSSYKCHLLPTQLCSTSYHNFRDDPDFIEIKHALIGIDNDLNKYQKDVLDSIITKNNGNAHNLIVQPTGSGKSLCFQLPILYNAYKSVLYNPDSPTMGIVITPTISLIEDQVQQMRHKINSCNLPLKVACYHHCLLEKEKENVINEIKARYINMLYVTPESLMQIKDEINSDNEAIFDNEKDEDEEDNADDAAAQQEGQTYPPLITHIVFDECHLITETTILYRPQYCYELKYLLSEIASLSAWQSSPQIIALTASLTNKDKYILLQKLGIKSAEINEFVSNTWKRENLSLQIIKHRASWTDRNHLIDNFKFEDDKYTVPSIIYCQTKVAVNKVTKKLSVDDNNKLVESYHADCNRRERRELQTRFYENKTDVLVSTNAFGLGVNKDDVSSIIHLGIPPNLQRYYQETGRAGRKNLSHANIINYCYCYYDEHSLGTNDNLLVRSLFDGHKETDVDLHQHINDNLLKFYQMLQYLVTDKNYSVLTVQIVSEFLCDNFEYIFGYNPENYRKNGKQKSILYDSNNVLVDSKYYIAILKQLDYLKATQVEYFDVYIPGNLGDIFHDGNSYEVLEWFVNYLLNHHKLEVNQWNDVYVSDIQSKWDEHISSNEIKIEDSKDPNDNIMSLKRIESLLETIKIKYAKLYEMDEMTCFSFEKDVKDIGFELEDVDNKDFEIKNIKQLIEWDEDIKRQRNNWEYLRDWLSENGKKIIYNDDIADLFQLYFSDR